MKNIPNLLTTLRILLVPCFVYVYWTVPADGFYWPIVLLALSGLTDVADGMIARKFNMITPLGRFLDPVADKLTIAAVAANPWSAYGWHFEPDKFISALRQAIHLPVVNVKEDHDGTDA